MSVQAKPSSAIFRVARDSDIAAITDFTRHAKSGLTTVPRKASDVEEIIRLTHEFLGGNRSANRILFVAERDGKVLGISSVIPTLGLERPFYSFKRSRHARRSTMPDLSVKYDTLQLTTDFDGYTELASLYISPQARGTGLGRLLSYGRLAFIYKHPDLFEDRLMADIRGWTDGSGHSPFWTHLTSKFIPTSFETADQTSSVDGRFIIELLPSLPIMLNTLPKSVSDCAGRAHKDSIAALAMLEGVGFTQGDLCDVFDGGPSIECFANHTLIARTARPARQTSSQGADTLLHFTGQGPDFLATIGHGIYQDYSASKVAVQVLQGALENIYLAKMTPDTALNRRRSDES